MKKGDGRNCQRGNSYHAPAVSFARGIEAYAKEGFSSCAASRPCSVGLSTECVTSPFQHSVCQQPDYLPPEQAIRQAWDLQWEVLNDIVVPSVNITTSVAPLPSSRTCHPQDSNAHPIPSLCAPLFNWAVSSSLEDSESVSLMQAQHRPHHRPPLQVVLFRLHDTQQNALHRRDGWRFATSIRTSFDHL